MSASHVAELLPRMIRALALNPTAVRRDHPEIFRSLQAACEICERVGRCGRCLEDGSASGAYQDFCLNAPVLRALVAVATAAEEIDPRAEDLDNRSLQQFA